MRSRRWHSIQSGLPESAHGSPEQVKHALLVEVDGMSRNTSDLLGRLVNWNFLAILAREMNSPTPRPTNYLPGGRNGAGGGG